MAATGGERKLEIEAAAELADPRLYPVLKQLAEDWKDDDDYEYFRPALEQAITRSDPQQRSAAATTEAHLRTDLTSQLATTGQTVRLQGDYPRTRLIITGTDGHTELLSTRIWDNTDPVNFNYGQELASYLLTIGAAH